MGALNAVHELIDQRNLEIHFMPIVRLLNRPGGSSWRNFAFEALVRGPECHPLRQPAQLFDAANKEGVRQELELLCVEAALNHHANLPANTNLFVNVGLSTFLSDAFMDVVAKHRPPGEDSRTVVEVLEDEMPKAESFRERVAALEGMGYAVALDDLAADATTLHRLVEAGPVKYWKLDRSILAQWSAPQSWVRDWLPMITHAAREMSIEVVIEGIENPHINHLPALCESGITLGQGFVFGKPAILGPGLSQWRNGFCNMISTVIPQGSPSLIPVQFESRVRDLFAAATSFLR